MISDNFIEIDRDSRVPMYQQIVNSIRKGISSGRFQTNDRLPSINRLSESLLLSRDTVEKAYQILKEGKTIVSVRGKGYYLAKTNFDQKLSVLLLINKPSFYKMIIYRSFVEAIGAEGQVDLYIYHCDEDLFLKKLKSSLGKFSFYVIMPHFKDKYSKHTSYTQNVISLIEEIPKNQLVILDNNKPAIKGEYGAVYQDFEKDIYEALSESAKRLQEYEKIILVYPNEAPYPYPKRILRGFLTFCQKNNFDYEVLDEIYDEMDLNRKDAYIIIREKDLVNLIQQARSKRLKPGKDLGIICYNETPLKKLLGITVITTDFKTMAETAAYMIRKRKIEKVKNVFKYIERNSI